VAEVAAGQDITSHFAQVAALSVLTMEAVAAV
jgi:hypothetical protein